MKSEEQFKQEAQDLYDNWEILTWESTVLKEGVSLLAISRANKDDRIYATGITKEEAFSRFQEKLFFRKVEFLNNLISLGNR